MNIEIYHDLKNIHWEGDSLCLTVNGKNYKVDNILQISERLANATEQQRNILEICPTGYGIHWPLIDEDISIDGLLGFKHKYPAPEFIKNDKKAVV